MKRKPLQGLINVLRFNWHFFALALAGIISLLAGARWLAPALLPIATVLAGAGSLIVGLSLAATVYAYDLSGLYSLRWLDPWLSGAVRAVNIHAGFDETSLLLKEKHPSVEWQVFDFYDPAKHTEISIKRARAVHPLQPGTRTISTGRIPLERQALDRIVLMLAAHEIRDRHERIAFFRELHRVLADHGRVIVTEHLRDFQNLIAYTLGAWHFLSRPEWLTTFEAAGFEIAAEIKANLLITAFVLRKHGTTP